MLSVFLNTDVVIMVKNMLYLNNEFIREEHAQIKANDRGFLLGDGLFETLRCYQGKPFALLAHWQRLARGAEIINLPLTLDSTKTSAIVEELLHLNKLNHQDAGARITITRGNAPRGPLPPINPNPTILITCFPLIENPHPSSSLKISEIRRNELSPLCQFKSLCYLENIIARQIAKNQGFDDAIFLNTKNEVVCATTANLFFVKDNKLYTPDLTSGALPGITRQIVIALARDFEIETYEKSFSVDELLNADEIFITNSLIEIYPVKQVDHKHFDVDFSHKITTLLQKAFSKRIQLS